MQDRPEDERAVRLGRQAVGARKGPRPRLGRWATRPIGAVGKPEARGDFGGSAEKRWAERSTAAMKSRATNIRRSS